MKLLTVVHIYSLVLTYHFTYAKEDGSVKPNIILLLADDLGYGDLGYSGHPTSTTPTLDNLAQNGRFFNNFYVTNPICSPSRASLLTGRFSVRSGVYPGTFTPDTYLGLPRNETTIAQILKEQGYATQMVGKWHLGVGYDNEYLPNNFGFDNYLGIPYSHDMCPCNTCFPNNGSCLSGCWNWPVSCPLFRNFEIKQQPANLVPLTSKFLRTSQHFIKKSHDEETPFFLYYAFHHIHHPQFASRKFHSKNKRGSTGDSLVELDWTVKQLIHVLEHLEIINNTLIIFTSDNGPSLQRHELGGSAGLLRCGKGTTMEGGVRVPAIVSWPSKITPGRTTSLASILDILPTIAKITNANISSLTLDGVDFIDALKDPDNEGQREFLAIYPETPTMETGPYAVLNRQYKAHFYTQGSGLSDDSNYDEICRSTHSLTKHDPPLLFDLYRDPSERYNLNNNSDYSLILARIIQYRNEHMANMKWIPTRTQHIYERAQPCCTDRYCEPFPHCCDCPT